MVEIDHSQQIRSQQLLQHKRRRLIDAVDGEQEGSDGNNNQIYYHANIDRLNVLFRNDYICKMAENYLDPTSQKIIQVILQLATSNCQHCWSNQLFVCSIKQILDHLPADLPFKVQQMSSTGGPMNRVGALRYYLDALADSSMPFVMKAGNEAGGGGGAGGGSYAIGTIFL